MRGFAPHPHRGGRSLAYQVRPVLHLARSPRKVYCVTGQARASKGGEVHTEEGRWRTPPHSSSRAASAHRETLSASEKTALIEACADAVADAITADFTGDSDDYGRFPQWLEPRRRKG